MKVKCLLFFLFCCIFSPLFSQLSHRNLIVDGTASTQLFLVDNNTEVLLIATPTLSYFITDKFAVGGGIQLSAASATSTSFGLNTRARYYFSNQAYNAWFAATSLGFLTGEGFNLITGNIGIGLDLFLSPNIALENTLSIGFQNEKGVLNNALVFQLGTGLKFFFDRMPEGSEDGRNGILQRGSLFLGMTAGNIQVISQNGARRSNISLSPNIGKFLTNNWVVGANATIQNQALSGFSFFSLEAFPFLRYYTNSKEKRAVLFGEIGAGIRLESFSGNRVVNQTEINPTILAGVGLNYFLRPTVAFEIKGSYNYYEQSNIFKVNAIGIDFGFQFFFRKEG